MTHQTIMLLRDVCRKLLNTYWTRHLARVNPVSTSAVSQTYKDWLLQAWGWTWTCIWLPVWFHNKSMRPEVTSPVLASQKIRKTIGSLWLILWQNTVSINANSLIRSHVLLLLLMRSSNTFFQSNTQLIIKQLKLTAFTARMVKTFPH